MKRLHRKSIVVALSALMVGGLAVAGDIALQDVPQAARDAILREAAGATLDEIESEVDNGVTVYEAEWTVNGAEHEVAVLADGMVIESETEIPLESAPAAVRAAAAQHFGADAKVDVEMKTIVVYELETRVNGKEVELHVLPTGRVLGAHDDDKDDDDDAEGDDD